MVAYEVTVEVDDARAAAFEQYMREKHIPEIMASGCFTAIVFEQASPLKFRTRYEASTQADLDRYLNDHTAHFRTDFTAHFPEGVTTIREVWKLHQTWEG